MTTDSNCYVIDQLAINEDNLTSSTISEPDTAFNESAWDATTLYHIGEEVYIGAPSSNVTISHGSPALVTWNNNGLAIGSPIVLGTSGTLPAPFVAGQIYYLSKRPSANGFNLSETPDGKPVATTTNGSGTHTATARIHKVYQAIAGAWDAFTVADGLFTVTSLADPDSQIAPNTKVILTDGVTLPAEYSEGIVYYIRELTASAGTFRLSATAGGTSITSTGSGSGIGGLASNYNAPPMISPTAWAEVGPTNKWAMFSDVGGARSEDTSSIVTVITPGQNFDGLFLRAVLDGSTVEVKLANGVTTYYDYTIDLTTDATTGGATWIKYRYDISRSPDGSVRSTVVDLALVNLATHSNGVLTVTITKSGTVSVEKLRIGTVSSLGVTVERPIRDTRDYSIVEEDLRGNVKLKKGKSRRRFQVDVLVGDGTDAASAASVCRLMERYEGRTAIWIASTLYQNLMAEGYPVKWQEAHDPNVVSMQIVSV